MLSSRSIIAFVALLLAVSSPSVLAFGIVGGRPVAASTTSLGMFGNAMKDAFSNDDSLGKPANAGLKGGPKYNENVSINGKPIQAVVGQKVSAVAASARVRIPYNCKAGDCGTCMIKMNGRKVKACQMTIPGGRCVIETL